MRQEKLRDWIKAHGVSDAEVMMVLGLTSVNQYRNRMNGTTPFSPLERKALAEYTGMPEQVFERG